MLGRLFQMSQIIKQDPIRWGNRDSYSSAHMPRLGSTLVSEKKKNLSFRFPFLLENYISCTGIVFLL